MSLERLVNLSEIKAYNLEATDGEIGKFEEIYFDDSCFLVRFLVVNTDGRLSRQRVLLAPFTVGEANEDNKELYIELSKQEIENSPPIEYNQPLSRQYELNYFNYYGWPPYWDDSIWPPSPAIPAGGASDMQQNMGERSTRISENHLRSSDEILNYSVEVRDGRIGLVKSFIIDTQYWIIRYLEIETRKWLPGGKHVLVNTAWITGISWPEHHISVDLSRSSLQNAPEYDYRSPISRDYELQLFKYYGRDMYWK